MTPGGWTAAGWVQRLTAGLDAVRPDQLSSLQPPAGSPPPRQAAVLMLFSPGRDGAGEVLLTRRAADMRAHPGQVAFPGGSIDPDDASPTAAALREAQEETGLDPAGVEVLGRLPKLYLPPSHFQVTPVVGWWRSPSPVAPADPVEVDRVAGVSLAALMDPVNRFTTLLRSGHVGPAFEVDGLFIWGFTAGLLSCYLAAVGLERPWDSAALRPVPGLS